MNYTLAIVCINAGQAASCILQSMRSLSLPPKREGRSGAGVAVKWGISRRSSGVLSQVNMRPRQRCWRTSVNFFWATWRFMEEAGESVAPLWRGLFAAVLPLIAGRLPSCSSWPPSCTNKPVPSLLFCVAHECSTLTLQPPSVEPTAKAEFRARSSK